MVFGAAWWSRYNAIFSVIRSGHVCQWRSKKACKPWLARHPRFWGALKKVSVRDRRATIGAASPVDIFQTGMIIMEYLTSRGLFVLKHPLLDRFPAAMAAAGVTATTSVSYQIPIRRIRGHEPGKAAEKISRISLISNFQNKYLHLSLPTFTSTLIYCVRQLLICRCVQRILPAFNARLLLAGVRPYGKNICA